MRLARGQGGFGMDDGIAEGLTELRLRAVGVFDVADQHGGDLTPSSRKGRALLAYIAAHPGEAFTRDRLAALLWSDRGEPQARASLRQCLYEVRDLLPGRPLLALSADRIALSGAVAVWDVAEAAEDDDALLRLLGRGGDFLEGLDGLDAAFDEWLRLERARLAAARRKAVLARGEQGLARGDLAFVHALCDRFAAIDPADERVASLGLIADARGDDTAALRRRYAALEAAMRRDLGGVPSPGCQSLFVQLLEDRPSPATRLRPSAPLPDETSVVPALRARSTWSWLAGRRVVVVAGLALLALGLALASWLAPRLAAPERPPLVAITPFQNLTQGENTLVDGIWEDTRSALSRNPNLRVLGRTTVEAVADKGLDARAYRTRFGVDYLLEGSVRRQGQRVRMDVSLVRTRDGVGLWSQRLDGGVDDLFSMQSRIAGEIEGRVRGRLAPEQGRRPQNIATTGDVYTLYSQARAKLRQRDADGKAGALALLREAVARDPNFAPAWASLGVATRFSNADDADKLRAEGLRDVRRALELAPNLAQAHSALALVQDNEGSSAEQALRRAVALDPGDAEAWMWLGNAYGNQNRPAEALVAYKRAVEIEPLWRPAVMNKLATLDALNRRDELKRELARIAGAGDPALTTLAFATIDERHGNLAAAARRLIALRDRTPAHQRPVVDRRLASILIRLGYFEEGARLFQTPAFVLPIWRGAPASPQELMPPDARPTAFWLDHEFPAIHARLLPRFGRTGELTGYYRAAFRTPDDMLATVGPRSFLGLAPSVALALRADGGPETADALLARADALLSEWAAHGPRGPGQLEWLAEVRAAQGRDREALDALEMAVSAGYLPDGLWTPADLADIPAFARLRSDAAFQANRRRILDHLAGERERLGPIRL